MKITINTSAKNLEYANFLLGQAYLQAIENKSFMEAFQVTPKDLQRCEVFRRQMLKAWRKARQQSKSKVTV